MEAEMTKLLMTQDRGMFVAEQCRNNVMLEKPKTVLLVDKQPNEIVYFTRQLAIAGFAISVNQTGAGAIKSIKEHASDVVLLEIDLSDMDGIDVVKAIRENPERAQTPIIAISAFPYMKARCMDNGCNAFIQKPVKALELITQLRKLTRG
jgi:CheY-like chemotaxis protein